MTMGPRPTAAVVGAVALAALLTGCGRVHAGTGPGTAPAPAASAALRSALADRCPAHTPGHPASDVDGTDTSLEPLAADRVLLCSYRGPTGTGALIGHTLVTDRQAVDRLRAALNKLGPVPKGTYNCPNDTGASVLAVFTDGVHEVQLVDRTTGCSTVTNGARTRWVGASTVDNSLYALLRRP
jgi:hypothetical protein